LTNIRSLLGKFDEFAATVLTEKPDIICLTETWLNSSVDTPSIDLPNYLLSRDDRSTRKGGGVAVYVKCGITYHVLQNEAFPCKEIELLMMKLDTYRSLLLCVYIPPNITASSLADIRSGITSWIDSLLC
jgi:exonuclease III